MVRRIPMRERPDMRIQQKALSILQQPIGILQVGLAFADRLHLGPAQRNSYLELVRQKIVEARRPVERSVSLTRRHRVALLLLHHWLWLMSGCRVRERAGHRIFYFNTRAT